VAGTEIGDDGQPVMARPVSEPRFDLPFSGVYWQIEAPGGRIATSRSLWDQTLPPIPSGQAGLLVHSLPGPSGLMIGVRG